MKKLIAASASLLLGLMSSQAQLQITDFSTYFEGFNSTTPTVPTNWATTLGGTPTTLVYGTPGAGTSTTGNTSYALRPTSSATNNAFGGKVGASAGPAFLTLSAANDTGAAISGFEISFDYLQYTAGNRASTLAFSYSLDGTTFTTVGLVYSTGTGSYTATQLTGLNSGSGSFIFTSSILSQSNVAELTLPTALADGEDIYFRFTWGTAPTGGNNAHLGIDNFSLTAVPEPTTSAMLLGGLGAMTWVLRRKRQIA